MTRILSSTGQMRTFAHLHSPADLQDALGDMAKLRLMFENHQRIRGFSKRTLERRRAGVRRWCDRLSVHGLSLDTVRTIHLEAFLAQWGSPETVKAYRSDIRQFHQWGVKRELIGSDPTDDLAPPKVPPRSATPVAAIDVGRVLANTTGDTRLMIMLYAMAGLRGSEIARLRGEDIDLEAGRLIVRQGKGGKDSVLPLAHELAVELARWPRRGRIFTCSSSRACVYNRIKAAFCANDIDARPHDLRHSFGTMTAIRTNGNLIEVQRLMRHSNPTTTVRYVEWHVASSEVVTGLYPTVVAS